MGGHTEKTTDFWGNEKEVHYDADGRKSGETRFTTDFWGNPKQEHYDSGGSKVGETKAGTDFWGQSRAEHYDRDGRVIGCSRDETDWTGSYVQRHYDASHRKVGSTRRETGFFGGTKKVHEGEYFKTRGHALPDQTAKTSSGGISSSYGGGYSSSTTSVRLSHKEDEGLSFGIVFGRLISLVAIAALAVLMGFWENYRINTPYESFGGTLYYATFGVAILSVLIERSSWFGFLAGCAVAVGSTYGLSLYPVGYPYMTPSDAIVSGLLFAIFCAFAGWVAKKIAHGNRSGWVSVLWSWLILAIVAWQLFSISSLIVASEVEVIEQPVSNDVLVKSLDVQPTATSGLEFSGAALVNNPSNDLQATNIDTTYTVQKGDSLWKIAEKFYGDGTRWIEIAQANKLANSDLIHAGNVLIIP